MVSGIAIFLYSAMIAAFVGGILGRIEYLRCRKNIRYSNKRKNINNFRANPSTENTPKKHCLWEAPPNCVENTPDRSNQFSPPELENIPIADELE
jgi:hypothetical protein